MTTHRKLAAILSADAAGYSRLMGDDEKATVQTLTEYRQVFADHISRHQGPMVGTAGDSVLAVAYHADLLLEPICWQRRERKPPIVRVIPNIAINLTVQQWRRRRPFLLHTSRGHRSVQFWRHRHPLGGRGNDASTRATARQAQPPALSARDIAPTSVRST